MKGITLGLLFALMITGSAFGENPGDLSRAELISRLAQGTGMTNQALELALGKTPQKMQEGLDALTAIQVITQMAEAQDDKALTTSLDWVISRAKGKLVTGPLGAALTAVTLYKATLEFARDRVVIPALDERLYQEYRKYRDEDVAKQQGQESISTSFDRISGRTDLGYHVLKEKMYQDYISALNLNPALIGPLFARFLRSQVDTFWISILESRFQRDYMKVHRDELIARTWEELKTKLGSPGKPQTSGTPPTTRPALPEKPPAGRDETAKPRPTPVIAKPAGDASLQEAIQRFQASEEAKAAQHKADDVREGKSDTAYKFEWVVSPHLVGDQVVFASVMYQKRDAKSDWFGIGYAGDAQNPVKVPRGSFLSNWGTK